MEGVNIVMEFQMEVFVLIECLEVDEHAGCSPVIDHIFPQSFAVPFNELVEAMMNDLQFLTWYI